MVIMWRTFILHFAFRLMTSKNIDQARGNNTFKETFSEHHNITYTERDLEFIKKVFLLKLFIKVHNNLGETVIDTSGRYKMPKYKLPSLDVKVLPLAWNTNFLLTSIVM